MRLQMTLSVISRLMVPYDITQDQDAAGFATDHFKVRKLLTNPQPCGTQSAPPSCCICQLAVDTSPCTPLYPHASISGHLQKPL